MKGVEERDKSDGLIRHIELDPVTHNHSTPFDPETS